MTVEKDFLAAILDSPDDDNLRLVYADWLDEHGQPDRAEFIRLQVQLAHRPNDPEWANRARRAKELLQSHCKEWGADIPWGGRLTSYNRGLLTSVQGTAAQIAGLSKRVWQTHPIQELVLDGFAGRLDRVLALPYLPRVRRLWLFGQGSEKPTAADFKALATCPLLTGLESFTNTAPCGNELAAALGRCPSARGLTELSLLDDTLGDEGTVALCAGADNLRRLRRLRLRGRDIGPTTAVALARTPALAGLEALQLYLGPTGDEGAAALAGSPHLAGLRELELLSQGLGPAGAAALAVTPHLTRLVRLSLSGNRFGPEGARAVVSGRWAELATLELDCCLLFDNAAEAMARWGRLPALVSLNLARNKIGPAGATALSRAEWLARLTELNLENNPIGDAGARALREGKLTSLRTLRVSASSDSQ